MKIRNVMISTSYPMYFDALKPNINSKNEKKIIISCHIGPKTGHFPEIWHYRRYEPILDSFWVKTTTNCYFFAFSSRYWRLAISADLCSDK